MTKKKVAAQSLSAGDHHGGGIPADSTAAAPHLTQPKSNALVPDTRTTPPPLMICRNKHWKNISSFSGNWLSLPAEVLESLAYNNYYSPLPRPITASCLFDLVKIRRLIDVATSLAVRAANGTTSSSLGHHQNTSQGFWNGADAELLGIGTRGGGNAKLSRERKHRMREHATQKLAQAYRLCEISTSVTTMQATSALEDVAQHVIQRDALNMDAKYVHFFHEKIPSRALAESTTLDSLNDIIRHNPTEASTYRTRGVLRVFKDDHDGAIKDFTDGLAVFRLYHPQHENEQRDVILARDAAKLGREWSKGEAKVDEKDQPSSLELQFLFHRGNTYLAMACQHIEAALHGGSGRDQGSTIDGVQPTLDPQEKEAARARAEARKYVRTLAKRALRDYLGFLSHLDYTPGLSAEYTEAFLHKVSGMKNGNGHRSRSERLLDIDAHSHTGLSDALVKYERKSQANGTMSEIPKSKIHRLNALFAAVPPADLPTFPSDPSGANTYPGFNLPEFSEGATYHPLLTDVLHSLLLCHCLIQTSVKEHLRHAHMVARVIRVSDGYPVFHSARSPARADWIEISRLSGNWLNFDQSWDKLCDPPASAPPKDQPEETAEQRKELLKRHAIEAALGDDRVMDEASFQRSVKVRQMVAEEEELQRQEYNRTKSISPTPTSAAAAAMTNGSNGHPQADGAAAAASRSKAQSDANRAAFITTERAGLIVRWIKEAPPPSSGGGAGGVKKKSKAGARKVRKPVSRAESGEGDGVRGLQESVGSLDLD